MAYSFDFLETLVSINFPTGGTVLVKVIGRTSNPDHPVVPPCAAPAFSLPTGVKLVDKTEQFKKVVIPERTIITKSFFIWDNVAPFPTKDNYNKIVWTIPGSDIPLISYAGQFSQFVLINSGQFAPPNFPHQRISGFYTSAAEAALAAESLRLKYFTGHPGGSTQGFVTSGGTLIGGLSGPPLQDPFGASLDIPVVSPGSGTCTLTGFYLIRVPNKKTSFTVTVNVPVGGTADVQVAGFHGSKPTTVAQALTTTPDSTDGPKPTLHSTVTSTVAAGASGPKNKVTMTGPVGPPLD